MRLSVNGAVLVEAIDLFHADNVVPSGEQVDEADLRKGANELKVEVTGTHPNSKPANYRFDLGSLRIEPHLGVDIRVREDYNPLG